MNLAAILSAAVAATPTVVAGVEYLTKEASSATKQQLALDSLTVLTSGVAAAVPGSAALATEINTVFASLINLTVAGFNAVGTFTHKAPATT